MSVEKVKCFQRKDIYLIIELVNQLHDIDCGCKAELVIDDSHLSFTLKEECDGEINEISMYSPKFDKMGEDGFISEYDSDNYMEFQAIVCELQSIISSELKKNEER